MRISPSLLILLFATGLAASEQPLLTKPAEENADTGRDEAIAPTDDVPIRIWTAIFVDAKTKKPLPGILVDANVATREKSELQDRVLSSDESGEVKIPLRKGQCTSLSVRGPGWCGASGIAIVGDLPVDWLEAGTPPSNPDKPIQQELYRGTEVRGRLLLPDGGPASGVSLIAGVYCNQPPWISQEYIDNRMSHSYSVSEWPNWNASTTTGDDGSFSVTVSPSNVRGWIRIGTIQGGWSAIETTHIEKTNPKHALVRFAPFELEVNGRESPRQVDESSGIVDLGELRLSKGVRLRGRVVDADGRPLAGVHLFTSSPRGPYAGRKTVSQPDGSFEFMPMNVATFKLSPDAHLRDDEGMKNSRDVQAVFVSQDVTLCDVINPHELLVQALPHVDLVFKWVDRRVAKGSVSYYGGFTLTGHVPRADGSKAWWRGETVSIARDGKDLLVVKVPKSVIDLKIGLHPDQRVTPSYQDDKTELLTGEIELGDITKQMRRVIYGDEPSMRSKQKNDDE